MKILFAEDDRDLSNAVKTLLERNGYQVDAVCDGEEALSYALADAYDGIILDWMMPEKDGVTVLKLLRKKGLSIPCLLLTARDAVEDRVTGLDAGADDYLPKPFATSELIARVKALGRRSESYTNSVNTIGNVTLDANRFEMSASGGSVKLANKEFQLMELFMGHPGHVFSTEHLMEKIWGYDTESDIDVVWTHIGFVRKKLRSIGANVEIKTMRGAGYALEVIS